MQIIKFLAGQFLSEKKDKDDIINLNFLVLTVDKIEQGYLFHEILGISTVKQTFFFYNKDCSVFMIHCSVLSVNSPANI